MSRAVKSLAVAALAAAGMLAAAPTRSARAQTHAAAFRPPAVPLVAFSPYLSIWSEANRLPYHKTVYWDNNSASSNPADHHPQNLVSMVRVDGTVYRVMGGSPTGATALHQKSVQVFPTRTVYRFFNKKVQLRLTFLTPRLPSSLAAMTQPVTYITWRVNSADGNQHKVQLYYSTSAAVAVNTTNEKVVWKSKTFGPLLTFGPLTALKCGTATQSYFDVAGDPVGLDWGYVYTAASSGQAKGSIGPGSRSRSYFVSHGTVPPGSDQTRPQAVADSHPVEAFAFNLGTVGARPVSRHVMVAYDEVYAINYFGEYLRPYWRKGGVTPAQMLQGAAKKYHAYAKKARAFDARVMADATKVGGRKYAIIAALAYRQALAAMGFAADHNGQPLVFTKEETSNGDIATVDVIFPASPIFVLFNPQLEAASLVPVLNSAMTPRWKFPWAPHDLGTYPNCFGHYNSGGENMMVEESGNMIILAAAIARAEGSPAFAVKYWPLLSRWVRYLRKAGFDPGMQLSTNDFLGTMTHNANLSIKAIVAMGAWGKLCQMRGKTAEAQRYASLARRWARKWMRVDRTGNHYRMAFNQPNSWSMVYNLVWDQVLGLHAFPTSVRRREMAFYMTQIHKYGLPDRGTVQQTKTDFEVWTATLATKPAQFHAIINGIYKFLDQSKGRQPLADSYGTNTGWIGMHARPVVGAVFMPMLNNPRIWHYWASRAAKIGNNWAPLPPPPVVKVVVPTAQDRRVMWRYTTENPGPGWYKPGFRARGWKRGPAGFGTPDPGVQPRTKWNTDDIWMRRHFNMPHGKRKHLVLYTYHDEDIQVYINGVLAGSAAGFSTTYVPLTITRAGMKALHAGRNTMAVHVHQTAGGQFADVGLAQYYLRWKDHRSGR